jgi:hypothetical protein
LIAIAASGSAAGDKSSFTIGTQWHLEISSEPAAQLQDVDQILDLPALSRVVSKGDLDDYFSGNSVRGTVFFATQGKYGYEIEVAVAARNETSVNAFKRRMTYKMCNITAPETCKDYFARNLLAVRSEFDQTDYIQEDYNDLFINPGSGNEPNLALEFHGRDGLLRGGFADPLQKIGLAEGLTADTSIMLNNTVVREGIFDRLRAQGLVFPTPSNTFGFLEFINQTVANTSAPIANQTAGSGNQTMGNSTISVKIPYDSFFTTLAPFLVLPSTAKFSTLHQLVQSGMCVLLVFS